MKEVPILGGPRPGWQRLWRPKDPQPLPIKSSISSIFLLPTRSGITWAIVCMLLLLWSLNSTNNAGILLGCILLSALTYAAFMSTGRLMGLRLVGATCDPVVEGANSQLRLRFHSKRHPDGLIVEFADQFAPVVFKGDLGLAVLAVPTDHRGIYAWPVVRLTTRRPFGVSAAWLRLWPPGSVVVWPRLENSDIPCPGTSGNLRPVSAKYRTSKNQQQAEDISHLREYRQGDRWRDIDWKRVARTGGFWVRQFDDPPGGRVEINWSDTEGHPIEARIRRLAKWVNDAEVSGRESTLILPSGSIGPDRGMAHRTLCMTALAEMPRE